MEKVDEEAKRFRYQENSVLSNVDEIEAGK